MHFFSKSEEERKEKEEVVVPAFACQWSSFPRSHSRKSMAESNYDMISKRLRGALAVRDTRTRQPGQNILFSSPGQRKGRRGVETGGTIPSK